MIDVDSSLYISNLIIGETYEIPKLDIDLDILQKKYKIIAIIRY